MSKKLLLIVLICELLLSCTKSSFIVNESRSTAETNARLLTKPAQVDDSTTIPLFVPTGSSPNMDDLQKAVVTSEFDQTTEDHSQNEDFLKTLTHDTWAYLSSDWATDNHLPWSWRSAVLSGGDYVNTAEIGFYALSWVGAYDMGQTWSPSWSETEAEVTAVLDQLRAWQTELNSPNAYNNSVFYQWYWINPIPVVGAGVGDHVVPSVDNAWLAASLITIREYSEANGHSTLAQKANAILTDMDFTIWYDAASHRFYWGASENPLGGSQADYYSNENRIINFIAYALGDLTKEEFLLSLDALMQNPNEYNGITVKNVSWDGSFFTYAGPALFIREMETPYGFNTILPAVQAQIAYAQNQGYPVWGFSDCYDIGMGDYIQQGAPPANSPDPLETNPGLVSPHVSALALITPLATEAITNLQTISNTFPLAYESPYGFRDCIMANPTDPNYGQPSDRFSALNQEWTFLPLLNYHTGFIWNYFYLDEGVRQAHQAMYPPTAFLPLIVKSSQ